MVDFIPQERATPIRVPSTANLMIDSKDRGNFFSSCWDFQITKSSSILNGFFTRIGTTEVVMEWCEDNISTKLNNTSISFDISGIGANTYSGTQTIPFAPGFYNAKEAYDTIVAYLNTKTGITGCTWAVDSYGGGYSLDCDDGFYTVGTQKLAAQLDLSGQNSFLISGTTTGVILDCPDLRPYRYVDMVSSQLTYNQELKDASTAALVRDVLCRWYFADDVPDAYDGYGFPILMGYQKFVRRRLYNPPKQIKWSNSQPIGNLAFQVFDDTGQLLPNSVMSNFLMTLQISEV